MQLGISIVTFVCSLSLQAQHSVDVKPAKKEPPTSQLRIGRLSNGFTYYIHHTGTGSGELDINLIVKAGKNQEDSTQTELSHLLEHLGMGGTKNFPDVINYFQAKGLKRGSEINAYTPDDYTGYCLRNIGSSDKELVRSGLLLMRDIADGNSIIVDSTSIDSERNVVWTEIKGGASVDIYMRDQYMKRIMDSWGYGWRSIEEKLNNLKRFAPVSLLQFYHDWYRSENEAIIVTGDIAIDSMEQSIRSVFGDMQRQEHLKGRKRYSGFESGTRAILTTHPDKQDIQLLVRMNFPTQLLRVRDDYAFFAKAHLLEKLMQVRFAQLQPTGSFNLGRIYFNNRVKPTVGYLETSVTIDKDSITKGIREVLSELERIRQQGFTAKEWEASKKEVITGNSSFSDYINEKSGTRDYCIDQFVYGNRLLDPEKEDIVGKELLVNTTLQQVNEFAKDFVSYQAGDIILLGPEQLKAMLPGEAALKEMVLGLGKTKLSPYQEKTVQSVPPKTVTLKPIMTTSELAALPGKKTYQQETISSIGVTKLTLSNGAIVLLKKMPGDNSESEKGTMFIRGISPGGAGVYKGADYFSALASTNIVRQTGVGGLTRDDMQAIEKEKGIVASTNISENIESIGGQAKVEDMELLLQLVYQYVVHPTMSDTVLKKIKENYREEAIRNVQHSIGGRSVGDDTNVWASMLTKMGIQVKSKELSLSSHEMEEVGLNRAFTIYKKQFGNAADVIFFLNGDFDLQKAILLVVKYLGSLPSVGKKDPPIVETTASVNAMNESILVHNRKDYQTAKIDLCFAGTYEVDFQRALLLAMLKDVLNVLLSNRLRDKEGVIYFAAGSNVSLARNNQGQYFFNMNFECDPAVAMKIPGMVKEEIKKLQQEGIDRKTLTVALAKTKMELNTNMVSSQWWKEYFVDCLCQGQPVEQVAAFNSFMEKLTAKDLQEAAQKYLSLESHFEIVDLPEGFKEVKK